MAKVVGSTVVVALAACSDAPTAPPQRTIDAAVVARVMPAVVDARLRITPAIENLSVRDRVAHDLLELENAMTSGDGSNARFHARLIGSLLKDYRAQQSTTTDGADVTAIMLMLNAVASVLETGYALP
ncbi:MAG TPA: hypothetical protein VFT29_06450 [Gemmatimonadaceae bacterium]|nr:hypothetical protein [Gemmatimonadaceae bacterium]